jgi:glycerophosphoryl diester phosphodiesterase
MASGTLRLAHRGDWRRAPENSLDAFLAALDVPGCDGLELDVRLAAGGTPVVIHDETLERVQGRPDRVDALGVAALRAAGVPTLAEVFDAIPRRAFVDVELKVGASQAIVEVLAAARGPRLHGAVVSSFDPATIEGIRRRASDWPCWLIAGDLESSTLRTAAGLGCTAVAAHWRAIDGPSLARARTAGLDVAAWTVRRRPTFRRLDRLGVIAVCVEAAALDGDGGHGTGSEVER